MNEFFQVVTTMTLGALIAVMISDCEAPKTGHLRGPCYPNSTCNSGLTCASKVYVELPTPERGP